MERNESVLVRAGRGLDVNARARWLLGTVFGLATVALLVGSWRAAESAESVQVFVDAEAAATAGANLETKLTALQREMWRFEDRERTRRAAFETR